MARPRFPDEGDGPQIWRVAANVLNSIPGQPIRGCPPAFGMGDGLTTPYREKTSLLTYCYTGRLTWMDSLENTYKILVGKLEETTRKT